MTFKVDRRSGWEDSMTFKGDWRTEWHLKGMGRQNDCRLMYVFKLYIVKDLRVIYRD